jgi:nucleotide-binding universal stress UspA family protein
MMRILLAVDNSAFSEAATQAVLRQAKPEDTEVRVLSVIELATELSAGGDAGYYAKIDAAFQEETDRSEALVAKTAELLRSKGFKVTSSAEGGDPRYRIIDVAAEWHADLIVLGSHGRTGLNRFLMGSVSEAIVRHAPCSVEIVRSASAIQSVEGQAGLAHLQKCGHPSCTCTTKSGKYCSAQCEAVAQVPDIDCRCGHPDCKGRAH